MKSLLIGLLLLLPFTVHSETTTGLYYGAYTDHMFSDNDYNENNQLVLFQYNDWFVGTFSNSYYKRSHVIAWSFWDYRKNWQTTFFQFNATVGAATGYKDTAAKTYVGLVPSIMGSVDVGKQYKNFEYGVRTIYIPADVVNVGIFLNYKY